MKNFIAFFLIFIAIHSLYGQNRKYSIFDYTKTISDTVSEVEADKYYLVKTSGRDDLILSASRLLQNGFIIVKGEHLNPVNVNQKFYLLNNFWKYSKKISPIFRDDKKEHIFSVKYSKPFDIQSITNAPGIELVKKMDWANLILVKTTYAYITQYLLPISSIEFIDLYERTPVEESPLRQYNPSINRITLAKNHFPDLHGNVIISLKENSIYNDDIDLLSKVTINQYSSTSFTQHAKEMGTLIAGRGNSFFTGEGVSTAASLVCTDFSSLFAESPSYYLNYSIHVQNHSYGTGIENYYGNESVSYDQIANDIPELALVFSAGNAGSTAPDAGTYQGITGYANLTGDYKQAKNVLVIAAIDSTMNHVSLTSSGPAYDGRIKPELAVFGGEGTSESSAVTSGSIAMLQDYYQTKNGVYPSSATIKSLLIAGANEADSPGIDFRTGYGSINLNRSLQLIDSAWYQSGFINSNSTNNIVLNVPANTSQLKIVLSWIDPPANPDDAKALVNDLDMKAITPSNVELFPWVLDPSPNSANLSSPAIRGVDHLNNVEMISLDNPEAGSYSIAIQTPQLASSIQSYSIAYYIKPLDRFEWSYPTNTDYLEAGTTTYFRWENSYASQTANLAIKYGGGSWVNLGTVNTTDEQHKITLPNITEFAQVKMTIGADTYVSDTFTITQLPKLKALNDCASSFTLSWNGLTNITNYTLFGLENNALAPLLTTANTLLKLDKITYPQSYFAVQPNFSNNLKGLRSYSMDYAFQNAGCYLNNFLALLQPDDYVSIGLSVNLPQDIDQITIFKEFRTETSILQQFSPGTESDFTFQDYDIVPGRYDYSAQLLLKSGDIIDSEPISVFYTNESTVMVFPNPVSYNSVNVLNDFPGGTLELIDLQGNLINTFELVNNVENINLTGLQKGVYLYRIKYEGNVVASGRIIRL